MKLWKQIVLATAAGVAAVALFSGCGSSEAKSAAGSAAAAKTYVVATRGNYKPFAYEEDNGKLTGYEIEVLREIEKRDPSIHFDFKEMSVSAAFVAMDAGQVDLLANQMRYTDARAKKYIYPKEFTNYTERRLLRKTNRNDINSLDDLQGKTLAFTPNGDTKPIVEKYNETHNPPITPVYTDKGAVDVMNLVLTDRADAGAVLVASAYSMIKDNNWPLKILDQSLSYNPAFFVLKKDNEHQQLADKIDKALKSMKDDGTLKKLSETYLGGDYTVKPGKK